MLPGMSAPPVKTPCVKVCFVDPKAQICVGCFRTLVELGRWTAYSDAERDAIIKALPERETAYRRTGTPPGALRR